MKKNLALSILVWVIFLLLAPVGLKIPIDSTLGQALRNAEPFNSSLYLTSDSPSLLDGILHGQLVITPDAGASIGQVEYASRSMSRFQFPTWDPYIQSGRPLFPADGYNTGILDPIQFAISHFQIDIVQKMAIASSFWTFIFIFFSILVIRFFTSNPWIQVLGVLVLLSSKAFHYVPNHLITLGSYAAGVITFYLVLCLLTNLNRKNTLMISILLGFTLLNFSAFGFGIALFIYGCGFLSLMLQKGIRPSVILNYLLHMALSITIALPHVFKMRENQLNSTNSQLPYISETGSFAQNLLKIRSLFPDSYLFTFFLILLILCFLLTSNFDKRIIHEVKSHWRNNPLIPNLSIMGSLSLLGLLGFFEPISRYLGLNIQSSNLYSLPLMLFVASTIACFVNSLDVKLQRYFKSTILRSLSLPVLFLAFAISPFNAIHELESQDFIWISFVALLLLVVVYWKDFRPNSTMTVYFISFWIFSIPVAHQFYGVSFSVQDHNETLRSRVCAEISCDDSYRFLVLHKVDEAGVPVLTYGNANDFLYYPATASLYRFFEASGGLSLNSIDYADYIATVNSGLFVDDPKHPGSEEFLLNVQNRILNRDTIEFETSVEIQNRRNNYLVWNPDSPLIKYLSVKYLISERELPESSYYTFVYKFSSLPNLGRDMTSKLRSLNYYVYEVKNYLARASFPSKVIVKKRDTAQILKDLSFDKEGDLAVIDGDFPESTSSQVQQPGTVLSQDLGVNTLRIETLQDTAQYLLLNENFHPGWSAFVNGKETRISRANSVFMSVYLPKGKNLIELRFQLYSLSERLVFFSLPLLIFLAAWFLRSKIGRAT